MIGNGRIAQHGMAEDVPCMPLLASCVLVVFLQTDPH